MNVFALLAEERIREAQSRGDFDELPGKGRPLSLEDDSSVPEDLRMAYKVLKNAGYVPPEIAERKEIENLLDLLESAPDERNNLARMHRLEALVFSMGRRGRSVRLEANDVYYAKILARLGRLRDKA